MIICSRFKVKCFFIPLVILSIVLIFIYSGRIEQSSNNNNEKTHLIDISPTIYGITPTYYRLVQVPDLLRLAQTLMHVPNIFWVIIEDAENITDLVKNIILENGLEKRSVQLYAKTRIQNTTDINANRLKGVDQRNTGLKWVRERLSEKGDNEHSIVYFMDDDNTYSIKLFKEMSKIERGRVGVWPVGLVGGALAESPIVNSYNIVTGFDVIWGIGRRFPMDMAGFAISGDLLLKFPDVKFGSNVAPGQQETTLLSKITDIEELQPLANLCKDVLVWHTRTITPYLLSNESTTISNLINGKKL